MPPSEGSFITESWWLAASSKGRAVHPMGILHQIYNQTDIVSVKVRSTLLYCSEWSLSLHHTLQRSWADVSFLLPSEKIEDLLCNIVHMYIQVYISANKFQISSSRNCKFNASKHAASCILLTLSWLPIKLIWWCVTYLFWQSNPLLSSLGIYTPWEVCLDPFCGRRHHISGYIC